MRVVVQRSGEASCTVDNKVIGKIKSGLVILVGFCDGDSSAEIKYMAKKIANLRIFPDENDVMNLSILDYGGQVLSISQFTLYGDASGGNRPSYVHAMKPEQAIKLYEEFNEELKKYVEVETGEFGANMSINLTNIGPTTILLER